MSAGCPTVQLLHTLPDGTWHVDWMIAQDPHGREPLVTFRLPRRLDELAEGQRIDGRRIADHRPDYLTYEGPVSGDRGSVRRIAAGRVLHDQREAGSWRLQVLWRVPGRLQYQWLALRSCGEDHWQIAAEGAHGDSPSRAPPAG